MKFSIYKDRRGEFRWRLVAANGQIVADSGEGYETKTGCEEAVQRIKTAAGEAAVEVTD